MSSACATPGHQHVAALDDDVDTAPDGQADLGRHMAEGQSGNQRYRRAGAHRIERRLQRVAAVLRRRAPGVDGAHQHQLLRRQHTRLQQLQQAALDAVGVLVDLLDEQNAAADAREMRRAEQAAQGGEVAAPQRAAHTQTVMPGIGTKAHRLELATHRFAEDLGRDLVDPAFGVAAAEVVDGQRPGPAAGLGMRQQAQLQRRQVAVADPACATLDAAGKQRPVDAVEQPHQPVAAARCQSDGRRRVGHPVQRDQSGVVAAGKSLVAGQRIGVQAGLETHPVEAAAGQAQSRRADDDAGGRKDGEVHGGGSPSMTSPVGMAASARSVRRCARFSAKNSRSSALQGSASTPPVTWV